VVTRPGPDERWNALGASSPNQGTAANEADCPRSMLDPQTRQAKLVELLTQHRVALQGFILACVRNHSDAEDIFQEVSLAISQLLDRLQRDEDFLVWAREIARRRILAFYRERGRERTLDPELLRQLAEAAERLEHRRPSSLREAALSACLEALPEKSRQVIEARYGACSAEQLAAQFGRSLQSIYATVKRIKMALRDCVHQRLAREEQQS
jgi:RNA polymerase sigma-70 factor (ECF subfamily)